MKEQLVLSAIAEAIMKIYDAVGTNNIQTILEKYGFKLPDTELENYLNRLVEKKPGTRLWKGHFFNFHVDLIRLWIMRNKPTEQLAKK